MLGVIAGHAYGNKAESNPGTRTIAAMVGRDPGHVRRLIRALAARGLVEVHGRGRARVFFLPWKRAPAPVQAGAGARGMRAPAPPEETRTGSNQGTTRTPQPSASFSSAPGRKPDPPEAVAQVVTEVVTVFGPAAEGRGREAVESFGADWVSKAVGVAVKAKGKPWGFVLGVLRNWQREGGPLDPPPPKPRPPVLTPQKARPPAPAVVTDEDLAIWRQWARDPQAPQQRWARNALREWEAARASASGAVPGAAETAPPRPPGPSALPLPGAPAAVPRKAGRPAQDSLAAFLAALGPADRARYDAAPPDVRRDLAGQARSGVDDRFLGVVRKTLQSFAGPPPPED